MRKNRPQRISIKLKRGSNETTLSRQGDNVVIERAASHGTTYLRHNNNIRYTINNIYIGSLLVCNIQNIMFCDYTQVINSAGLAR